MAKLIVLLCALVAGVSAQYGYGHGYASSFSTGGLGLGYGRAYAAPLAYAAPARVAYAAPARVAIAAPARVAYAAPARVAYAAPAIAKVAVAAPAAQQIDFYDPNPQYSYHYGVQDAHTGDVKEQQESRDGDVVHGSYSLVEPDGTRRTVEYTADPHNGFNAVVHREPAAHPAPVVQKVIAAAPAYLKTPLLAAH